MNAAVVDLSARELAAQAAETLPRQSLLLRRATASAVHRDRPMAWLQCHGVTP